MKRLVAQLREQQVEATRLDVAIEKKLRAAGIRKRMIEQIPNDLGKTRRTVAEQVADCKALTFRLQRYVDSRGTQLTILGD